MYLKLFFLATILISQLKGQVKENMLMERFNMNAFNPAYVGSDGREVSFTTRSSWKGVKDVRLGVLASTLTTAGVLLPIAFQKNVLNI